MPNVKTYRRKGETQADRDWERERSSHLAITKQYKYAQNTGRCPICHRAKGHAVTCGQIECVRRFLKIKSPAPQHHSGAPKQTGEKPHMNDDKAQVASIDMAKVLGVFEDHPAPEGKILSDDALQLICAFYAFTETPLPSKDHTQIAVAIHKMRLASGTFEQQATSRQALEGLGY